MKGREKASYPGKANTIRETDRDVEGGKNREYVKMKHFVVRMLCDSGRARAGAN